MGLLVFVVFALIIGLICGDVTEEQKQEFKVELLDGFIQCYNNGNPKTDELAAVVRRWQYIAILKECAAMNKTEDQVELKSHAAELQHISKPESFRTYAFRHNLEAFLKDPKRAAQEYRKICLTSMFCDWMENLDLRKYYLFCKPALKRKFDEIFKSEISKFEANAYIDDPDPREYAIGEYIKQLVGEFPFGQEEKLANI